MIKINLLRSLKEGSDDKPSGTISDLSSFKGFLAKLFPGKKAAGEAGLEDAGPEINPSVVIVKLVLIFAGVGGLYYYESINIPKLQNELAAETQKLNELVEYNNKAAASVAEIKKLQELKIQIEKQIESLDGLSKIRVKYVKAIDLIQTNLPEKMWFLDMRSRDNVIEASGISISENEITQFLDVMGRSAYFSDVSMLSSEDVGGRDTESKKFKKFQLNFVLEGNK